MNDKSFSSLKPEFFRRLWESSPNAALVFKPEGTCIYSSPGLKRIMSLTPDEEGGLTTASLLKEIHPEDLPYVQAAWEKIVNGQPNASVSILFRLKSRSGDYRLAESTVINQLDDQDVQGIVFHMSQVVDRKLAEDMLLSERERLLVTLRSIGDGVIATDIEGRVTLLNKVAEQLTGWDHMEAIGQPLPQVFHIINEETGIDCENPVEKVFRLGHVIGLANHTALIAKNGRRYSIEDSAAPIRNKKSEIIGAVLVFRDVTQSKRDAEEIVKVQKLESIGVLAGGIAHDFNNILTAIMGNASLALLQVGPHSKLYDLLVDLNKAAGRATELTHQLLTFAKGGSPVLQPSSLHQIIEESARFILHGSSVECRFDLEQDLKTAEIDKGQIGQVIQNLILNAMQAMPNGGLIVVTAENILVPKEENIPLADGEYIRIRIRDQGSGIGKENLTRIFEPYFTTKQKGSGLGLSIVYSIMKNHGGWIRVESELGKGTSFFLYLPAVETEQEPAEPTRLQKPHKLRGRALVMDDEEQPRKTMMNMLEFLGYKCTSARHGEEALDLYTLAKHRGEPFDFVVLDLTVPGGWGGKDTVQKLKEADPKVKTLVSSGYSSDPILSQFRQFGFDGCLSKPFTMTDLSKALTQIFGDADEA